MRALQADDLVILEGARTPVGKFLGALKSVSPTELGVAAAREAMQRSQVSADWIDSVFVGNVIQSSKDAVYVARHVGLLAGVPLSAPALTVNRLCGSGLEALLQGARALKLGEARFVLAGGVENMSMTPYTLRGVREGWRFNQAETDDMLWSALTDTYCGYRIGETVENLVPLYGITRQEADEVAVRSQELACAAQNSGRLAKEIVPVNVPDARGASIAVAVDEAPRPGTTLEKLARLPPNQRTDGVVTAGNSSGLNDGGAMLVMTTGAEALARGLKPLGRLVGWGVAGVEPKWMGLGPVPACRLALQQAGLNLSDLAVIELSDSFTVQYLAVEKELKLNRERVNPNGGALALGHPMGTSGTRLALTALYQLRETGQHYALATLCIGGGQGIAVVLEGL